MKNSCSVVIHSGECLCQGIAGERPYFPRWIGDVDSQCLDDKSRKDDASQKKKHDCIIGRIIRLTLITETLRLGYVSPIQRHEYPGENEQSEHFHEEGED